jgi:predicted small integral membrane protein
MGLIAVLAVFVGETVPRRGFLPWPTAWGDRFFVSLLIFFLLALVWMRFIEPFIPIYWVIAAGLAIGAVIVKWG